MAYLLRFIPIMYERHMVNLVCAIIHATRWVIHCGYGCARLIGMQIQSLFAEREIKRWGGVIVADLLTVHNPPRMLKYGLFADFGSISIVDVLSCFLFKRRSRRGN